MVDIVVRLHYRGTWSVGFVEKVLTLEPHSIIVGTPFGDFRVKDCRCQTCIAVFADQQAPPVCGVVELTKGISQAAPGASVGLLLHPDMQAPLPDGTPSQALRLAHALMSALEAHGHPVEILKRESMVPPEGTWVRFTCDELVAPDNIVLEGMLGQTVIEHWGICTPGVSLYVRPTGAKEPYGYWCRTLVILEAAPTADAIEASLGAWHSALRTWVQRNGWCGLVPIGRTRVPESKARRDLSQLADQIERHMAAGRDKEAQGSLARMRRVLEAFDLHPDAAAPLRLAGRCRLAASAPGEVAPLLAEVRAWAGAPSSSAPAG